MDFNNSFKEEINKRPFDIPDNNFKDKTTISGDNISTDSKTSKIKWLEKDETSQIDIEEIDSISSRSNDEFDRKAFFEYKQHEFLNGNDIIESIKERLSEIHKKEGSLKNGKSQAKKINNESNINPKKSKSTVNYNSIKKSNKNSVSINDLQHSLGIFKELKSPG